MNPFISVILCLISFHSPESGSWFHSASSLSSLLVLDFGDVLIVTCGSSGISFGASSIITQAFSLATSAASWILWVSNSSGHLLFIYSSSVINSAISILSSSAEPPTKFSKRGGLEGLQLLEGDSWERGDDFVHGGWGGGVRKKVNKQKCFSLSLFFSFSVRIQSGNFYLRI